MALPWAFTLNPFGMIRSMPTLTGIGLKGDDAAIEKGPEILKKPNETI